MCSVLLKSGRGAVRQAGQPGVGAMTRWYGRQLDRSLDYRPVTYLFALVMLGWSASCI